MARRLRESFHVLPHDGFDAGARALRRRLRAFATRNAGECWRNSAASCMSVRAPLAEIRAHDADQPLFEIVEPLRALAQLDARMQLLRAVAAARQRDPAES